jgi:hypothetical protein
MLVDLAFDISVTARSDRNTARKLAGLLKPPKVNLRIRYAFGSEALVGN